MYENSKTLVELFDNSVTKYGSLPFLKYKEGDSKFKSLSYDEVKEKVTEIACALYNIGMRKGDKVGIISDNMYKWIISDMAILNLGAVDVPRGSDSTASEISYILKHSDAKYCFVEDNEQASKVISFSNDMPELKTIILLTGNLDEVELNSNIKIYHFDNLLEEGRILKTQLASQLSEIKKSTTREDLATLIYTSGTTGLPKGVMLLHKNIMHNIHSLTEVIPFDEGRERWVSVLPVWHVYERTVEYIIIAMGGVMAYSKPTAKHLLPDFAEIKPTYMVSVPRIWESIYNGVINNIKKESPVKRGLFYFFTGVGKTFITFKNLFFGKVALFKKKNPLILILEKIVSLFVIISLFIPNLLGNLLVFSKIRQKTGGKVKGLISGGGALPEFVDKFFSSIGIHILEGYGLTETAPIISVRSFDRLVLKTVGKPAPGVEVMIGDDSWNRLANQSEKGIIYIKGDLVMGGYYKNPNKTNEILRDGWLNTGDLGRMTINGEIQITGRAKDTIVLSGGENIEPEPIENKLLEESLIHQVIVVGQDKKNLGAIIIPQNENLEEFAKNKKIGYKDYNDLCKNKDVIEEFSKLIKHKISSLNGFKAFEKITCFTLITTPFEVGKELTLSLKMKRNVIMEKYHNLIEEMYSKQN